MSSGNPYRAISTVFVTMVVIGTALLMLPIARTGAQPWDTNIPVPQAGPHLPGGAPLSVALFSAASASCVTGLIVVDTARYWSVFGQSVIMILMEIGGIGTMTVATFIAVTLRRKLTLRRRVQVATSVSTADYGGARGMVSRIIVISLTIQGVVALLLTLRFWVRYGYNPLRSVWYGVFHSVSSYNNAGFALFSDSLMGFAQDPFILFPIMVNIVLGGLGFPVFVELLRDGAARSMHSRIVLAATPVLIIVGAVFFGAVEWNNPRTFGSFSTPVKLMNALFASISPRTAGFNSVDVGAMHPTSWLGMDFLMSIGAGPASTAGGLKVTTIVIVFAVAAAQVRGRAQVTVAGKKLAPLVQSQVITVIGLSTLLITFATMFLMLSTPFTLDRCLFEVTSAFGTVGLTTGITPSLPITAQFLIVLVMIVGRLGPVTLASSLAIRSQPVFYELPEDRPIIG